MDSRIAANRRYLADLFAGPFPGHAIVFSPATSDIVWPEPGDVSCSTLPISAWVSYKLRIYERRLEWSEHLRDDAVPFADVMGGTQLFAQAFGCPVHVFSDSNPCAMPRVTTAAEADALEIPSLEVPPLRRVLELAEELRRRLGPEVPIAVPDIQSPVDIAALIWRKEDFFVAMIEEPEAANRLIEKCQTLLINFLHEFKRRIGEINYCHCPYVWAPPELGCSLSEDEAGSISTAQFEEFCLPTLTKLSQDFGGLFMHCCAAADHQYDNFARIPNLRGLNRVFQAPGPEPAIQRFAGSTVLMQAWSDEPFIQRMLDAAKPESRFLFNMSCNSLEEAVGVYDRLRQRCPRREVLPAQVTSGKS